MIEKKTKIRGAKRKWCFLCYCPGVPSAVQVKSICQAPGLRQATSTDLIVRAPALLPNGNIKEDLHRCCCLAPTFSAFSAFWSRVKSGPEFSTFSISTIPWFSFVSFVFDVRRTDCQCKRSCTWRHRAMSTNPVRSLFWSSVLMR